mmetsp:Transcript_96452/g.152577  ORF Transcript_96452/g.152577 Transcript_96452/m.152577 type:complete len:278 (+) Transcript_96452:42-875(+)
MCVLVHVSNEGQTTRFKCGGSKIATFYLSTNPSMWAADRLHDHRTQILHRRPVHKNLHHRFGHKSHLLPLVVRKSLLPDSADHKSHLPPGLAVAVGHKILHLTYLPVVAVHKSPRKACSADCRTRHLLCSAENKNRHCQCFVENRNRRRHQHFVEHKIHRHWNYQNLAVAERKNHRCLLHWSSRLCPCHRLCSFRQLLSRFFLVPLSCCRIHRHHHLCYRTDCKTHLHCCLLSHRIDCHSNHLLLLLLHPCYWTDCNIHHHHLCCQTGCNNHLLPSY